MWSWKGEMFVGKETSEHPLDSLTTLMDRLEDMKHTHVSLRMFRGRMPLKPAANRTWLSLNHRAHMGDYPDQEAALWKVKSQDAILANESHDTSTEPDSFLLVLLRQK